jgi:hypothetical protein
MKKEEAREFCRKWLPAWIGNQPDKLIDFYSENAFYLDPANKNGLKGRDQILPYFKKLLGANPKWIWEATEIFPTDQGFIVKWRASIPVGSETIIENGIDIVEIKTGRIIRNEVYFDRSTLMDAIKKLRGTK